MCSTAFFVGLRMALLQSHRLGGPSSNPAEQGLFLAPAPSARDPSESRGRLRQVGLARFSFVPATAEPRACGRDGVGDGVGIHSQPGSLCWAAGAVRVVLLAPTAR